MRGPLLASGLGLLTASLLVEAVSRLVVGSLGWPLGDHYLIKPTPYFSPRLDSAPPHYGDLRVERSSSGLQLHDPNGEGFTYTWEKPTSTLRVVCVGDSITQIWPGTPNYTHSLSDALSDDLQRDVQAVPLGLGGYNPDLAMSAYSDWVRALNPDLLLLQLGPNDIDTVEMDDAPPLLPRGQWGSRQLRGRNHKTPSTPPVSHATWWGNFTFFRLLLGDRNHGIELKGRPIQLLNGLEAFSRLAEELDIPSVAVIFPFFRNGHTPLETDLLLESLRETNIGALDLTHALRQNHSLDDLSRDGIHPNPIGHRLAGKAIAGYLKETFEGP